VSLKLVIANKAYSSWSLRPWMLLQHFRIPFEETVIPLDRPETRQQIFAASPSGRCPVLIDGATTVWDSLAILEYIAEKFPEKAIWPRAKRTRATARSLAAEMHSGFAALRNECPTQFRRPVRKIALSSAATSDVERIERAWTDARAKWGRTGAFLFGAFSAADAMFAPVVNRIHIYDIDVGADARAYCDAIRALPAWKAWIEGAEAEPWRIASYDAV